jgi:hypothetical protein
VRIRDLRESGEIYDKRNFDPQDPEVLIHGYGRLTLSQIDARISKLLQDMSERAAEGDIDYVDHQMINSNLNKFISAAQDARKELQTPQMKRRVTMMRKDRENS